MQRSTISLSSKRPAWYDVARCVLSRTKPVVSWFPPHSLPTISSCHIYHHGLLRWQWHSIMRILLDFPTVDTHQASSDQVLLNKPKRQQLFIVSARIPCFPLSPTNNAGSNHMIITKGRQTRSRSGQGDWGRGGDDCGLPLFQFLCGLCGKVSFGITGLRKKKKEKKKDC